MVNHIIYYIAVGFGILTYVITFAYVILNWRKNI